MTTLGLRDLGFVAASSGVLLWTPAQITTALWLDAADSSTVTTVSGAVSQWSDKSGNGRDVSQSNSAQRPIYTSNGQNGRNVLTFDGIEDWMQLSADFVLGTAHTIFVVVRNKNTITESTVPQIILSGGAFPVPAGTSLSNFAVGSITGNLTNERIAALVVTSDSSVKGYGKTDSNISGAFIACIAFTTSGNAFTGRLNGAADFATASAAGGFDSTNIGYFSRMRRIGKNFSDANYWDGDFCEIVVSTSYLSTSTIQQTEGYLAHKWGLTASLPSGHPYKSTPPTV